MIRFYGTSAADLFNDPAIFLNSAVSCTLVSGAYAYDSDHDLSDIVPVLTNGVELFAKTVVTVDGSKIYDAADVDLGVVPTNVSYGYILFHTDTTPLFLLSDISGLPGISAGGQISISFSSARNKILAITPSYTAVPGTHFVYAKEPVREPGAPATAPQRPGGDVTIGEAKGKNLSGKAGLYKDISIKGRAHPLTGDITTVVGKDAVNQALRMILLTDTSERPFSSRNIAGNINALLFDNYSPGMDNFIKNKIMAAISSYEPRIIVYNVSIKAKPEENGIIITIVYGIKTTNTKETFSLFLERA